MSEKARALGTGRRRAFKAVFLPNFLEAFTFALVVAKNVHAVALARPAMELRKELAALCFRDLRIRSPFHNGSKGIQAGYLDRGVRGVARRFSGVSTFLQRDRDALLFLEPSQKFIPIDEKRIVFGYERSVISGLLRQQIRLGE